MTLYPFQDGLLGEVESAWGQGFRNICLQSPTGSGKTVMAGEMIRRVRANNTRVLILVHREELIKQFSDTLTGVGLAFDLGVIKAGKPMWGALPIQIASVQTLVRRLSRLAHDYDMIMTDEAHHAAASTYQTVYNHFPSAYRIGFTATPARLDGKPLLGTFDHLILGPEPSWLIEHGYLSTYEALEIDPGSASTDGETIADVRKVILDYAEGRKTIVFCASRAEAQHITTRCQEIGISAEYLDGETPLLRRRQILERLEHGNLQVICNVDLISEGFDCPNVECIIMNRPTESITVHLQQIGRALRKSERPALILDLVGNLKRLGRPDDKYIWSLSEGVRLVRPEKTKADPLPPPVVPASQTFVDVEVKLVRVSGQQLTIRPGQANGSHSRDDVNRAVRQCQSLDQLMALARDLGYSPRWATRRWELKQTYAKRYH